MATMDKLMKALEALKVVQPPGLSEETQTMKKKETPLSKKEKISYCSTIADAICSQNLRSLSDFPKFLGFAMDTFLLCCDDDDSDVRLMADECLNRTIKTLLESDLGRLQVELYKQIKKDGSARSLRAALSRFADLCHLIKPQKCRPYTVNLLPCLAKICQRGNEELVQETLAVAVTKVMPVLGQFTYDKETKMILKAFLPNLTSNSATVRRAAAASLRTVCQHSRRPLVFYSWLLSALFDFILPVQEEHSVSVILGVLLCLRHIIPQVNELISIPAMRGNIGAKQSDEDSSLSREQVLKVYEITLYYTHHPDHNVVTASLETLHQLLKTAPRWLQMVLLSSNGITKSLIYTPDLQKLNRTRSESQNSVLPSQLFSMDDSALEDDQDVYIPDKSETEHHSLSENIAIGGSFDQSEDSVAASMDGEPDDISEYSGIRIGKCTDDGIFPINATGIHTFGTPRKSLPVLKKGASDEKLLDTEDEFWDHSNSTPSPGSKSEFKMGIIGSFTDSDVPLKYCTRLLCSSFLLTGTSGMCMPDRNVRVSVKSLTLGCMGSIFSLYPKAFFLDLHQPDGDGLQVDSQKVWDVLLYVSHPDPHLKGQSGLMLGYFICHALRQAGGLWDHWMMLQLIKGGPSLESLIAKLIAVIHDNSSVALKLGLSALKQCLNPILQSVNGFLVFPIFDALLSVKNNSYWLVKVELVDVIADISFKEVHYLECQKSSGSIPLQTVEYQERFLRYIFIPFLGDEDFRVRQATSASLVKIIPNLFYPLDHSHQDPVNAIAKENVNLFLGSAHRNSSPSSALPHVHSLMKPFCNQGSIPFSTVAEGALSRIINLLVSTLRICTNKHRIYGCCQTLCFLSEAYYVTEFSNAWAIAFGEGKCVAKPYRCIFRQQSTVILTPDLPPDPSPYIGADLFNHLVALLTHTSLSLDLLAHQHALQLTSNLMCGACFRYLQQNLKSLEASPSEEDKLNILKDNYLIPVIEQVFVHLMRLLNIFVHVLDEQAPVTTSSRPSLPSLPNAPSLSPIKRKSKGKDDALLSGAGSIKGSPSRILHDKTEGEKEKTYTKNVGNVGQFYTSPLYMKLYEILKGSHNSYKISMDFQSSEKFCHLLRCALDAMSQLLEVADSQEMGKHAEEMLTYLKTVMLMEPCSTVQCVRQLLKSLFGTNLISLYQEAQPSGNSSRKPGRATRLSATVVPGLYHCCITAPYTQFTHSLANKNLKSASGDSDDELISSLSWMKRSEKLPNMLKSGSKGDKANLAANIRLFEGVVIKALKQYTVTSNVNLQCQVLDLLAQLVQLRVNYCLLDSDQIFIGFVIKQFEYIEEGQIMNASVLIPRIFYFLVLLSYERFHSKAIISVPKILQLCDGLIASGQPPDKFVIRALQPVIEDLFVLRGMNKMDLGKELDAQREVVISTLFKLVCYPQVLELFLLIINQSYKEGEDKWKKLSRQIGDIILPLLSRQQLRVDNQSQLEVLQKLLESVSSIVFRPVDILLKVLFSQPKDLTAYPNLHRWMCMILAVMRILMSQAKEEVVLSRLGDMGISLRIHKLGINVPTSTFQPYASTKQDICSSQPMEIVPEIVFARFLFQVVGILAESIYNMLYMSTLCSEDNTFLCQQMANLLLYLMHMFQSGTFRRVTTSAMGIVKTEISEAESDAMLNASHYSIPEINDTFLRVGPFYPTLVIQWCNVLTLLNCDSQIFWSQILQPYKHLRSRTSGSLSKKITVEKHCSLLPCNIEMVRRGGIILLCDYVCENPNDAEQMTWLIINHVNDLIHLSLETTVQDFISAIHRNAAASGLFIQAINARCEDFSRPSFLKRTLHCLESIHPSQSGSLLMLLINKFLSTHHVAVSRKCDNLACRRVEILLSETINNAITQLSVEDIDKLLDVINSSGIKKRHQHLTSLLERLRTYFSGVISPSLLHPLAQSIIQIQDTDINKEWFLKYVRTQCYDSLSNIRECSLLLSQLKYEDASSIMMSKEFHLSILEQCLNLGVELSIAAEKNVLPRSNDPFLGVTNSSESALYRASRNTVLQHVTQLVTLFPQPSEDCSHLYELYADESFWEILCQIVPAVSCYLKMLKRLSGQKDVPTDYLEDISVLSIMCCEALAWIMKCEKKLCSEKICIFLDMLDTTLKNSSLSAVIGLPEHTTWVFSAVTAIHQLVNYLQKESTVSSVPFPVHSDEIFVTHEQEQSQKVCYFMSEMVCWLETSGSSCFIPEFIAKPLKSVIRGLARIPLVNSFARTPPVLWQMGWSPEFSGDYKTLVPPPPGEYLQDRDVLKQYIFRINLLGWISRQQFEETWMALLGVLSATPVDDVEGKEEDQERIRTSCLAVKSITSLLLQTLLLPQPGNPQNSSFLVQPRDKPLAFLHTKCGKKLLSVISPVHRALQDLLHHHGYEEQLFNMNTERVPNQCPYSLSQVSLEYLCAAAGLLEDNEDTDGSVSSSSSPLSASLGGAASYHQREQNLAAAGLDIHSCLHFLLDLYSQWLCPQACPGTPLTLLTEVARSVVILSDIFMERAQFEWMLDTLLEVHRIHPAEDEIIAQYLIFGICKAAAVLGMEQDMLERLKKLLELSLKSTFLPTRISTLHGLLYLLEQGGGDHTYPLLPTASDYVIKHLDLTNLTKPSSQNEDHMLIMWALAFYIIENYQEGVSENEFSKKVFHLSLSVCGSNEEIVPTSVYLTILHGLERLLIAEVLTGKEADLLIKLTVDRIRSGSPLHSIAALGVLLSCMYIGKSTNMWSNEIVVENTKSQNCGDSGKQVDSELLIAAMERVTTLFDRIRRGYPFEAEVVCRVLPSFLMDFFPAQQILNKIIGEFLSSQQPHPQLMARVIFEVFQYLHQQSMEDLIQDWVLLSLSNFTQRSPIAMAMWSLTCFFISATSSTWLQALFPYVQNRMGKMEEQDKVIFCIAGHNFRNQLKDDEQRQAYFTTIRSVAHPDTPYADLLSCL